MNKEKLQAKLLIEKLEKLSGRKVIFKENQSIEDLIKSRDWESVVIEIIAELKYILNAPDAVAYTQLQEFVKKLSEAYGEL